VLLPAALLVSLVVSPVGPTPRAEARGIEGFEVTCQLSHRLRDDPIVRPSQPGTSHKHDFFGSRVVNAAISFPQAQNAPTSCTTADHTAAYWAPTLYLYGQKIAPRSLTLYYVNRKKDPSTIEAFPPDLRMVAGNSQATAANPQPLTVSWWTCTKQVPQQLHLSPAACGPDHNIAAHIRFPDCWDGVLTHRNDTSHLAYSPGSGVRCPEGFPRSLPSLTMRIEYPVVGSEGGKVKLSSGSLYSMHADFWNTWQQPRLEELVGLCNRQGRFCRHSETEPRTTQ
jgi:hypothetical protein